MGATSGVKGPRHSFQGHPSADESPHFSEAAVGIRQIYHSPYGDRANAFERGSGGTSGGRSVSGFLFPAFSGSQEIGPVETYNRPEHAQPLYYQSALQNDYAQIGHCDRSTWPLGYFNRFERRLFPCASGESLPEVPSVYLSGQGIPISSIAFRPHHGASHFYKIDALGGHIPAFEGGRSSNLLRRFPRPEFFSGRLSDAYSSNSRHICSSGLHPIRGQIRDNSFSGFYFSGLPVSSGPRYHFASRGEVPDSSVFGAPVCLRDRHFGPQISQDSGLFELHRGRSSAGSTSLSHPPSAPPQLLVSCVSRLGVPSSSEPGSEDFHSVVDQSRQCPRRGSAGPAYAGPDLIHRCFTDRLGRISERSNGQRCMGVQGVPSTHKCTGNEGSASRTSLFYAVNQEQSDMPSDGQLNGGGLSQQPRGHKISGSMLPFPGSSSPMQGAPGSTCSEAYPGSVEHTGRHSFTIEPTSDNRVDALSVSVSAHMPILGSSAHRSLCNSSKSQASDIRVPSSRRRGFRHGRFLGKLGRDECVRISPIQPGGSSFTEDQGTLVCSDSDCTPVVGSAVVPGPVRSTGRLSTGYPPSGRSTVSASISRIPREAGHAPPSRLEAIQEGCIAEGFSQQVADRIPRSVRPSSSSIYASRWKIFCDWCVGRQIDPVEAPVTIIADFLLYLFKDKGLSPSTVSGYKSAIANVFSSHGRGDIGADRTLSALLRGFYIEKPRSKSLFPQWNLALVLDSLLGVPYEPLHRADLKFLTYKCVFLLALATGRRRGDIHALSMNPSCLRWAKDYSWVKIATDPTFVAKNQLAHFSPEPVQIPSLSKTVGNGDRDRLLCPVRSLRFYLDKTRGGAVRDIAYFYLLNQVKTIYLPSPFPDG